MTQRKLTMLLIMDGWGICAPGPGNACSLAETPNLDRLWADNPHTELIPYGEAVGLPAGQMGNSEVGHLNLGAGRVVYQDIVRISKAIESGEFFDNPAFKEVMAAVKSSGGALHLLGLISDGGVHSLLTHLYALIDMARQEGVDRVFVHAFMDGRDTPPKSGLGYLKEVVEVMAGKGLGRVATVGGRYWGMDRDKRWERVERHYEALVRGRGRLASDPLEAMAESYENGETDEFITPTVIVDAGGRPLGLISDGDGVIFFNFRADRAREMTRVLTWPGFDEFDASDRPRLAGYVTMTNYDETFDLPIAFPPVKLTGLLGEVVSKAGLKQLRIAETEKYAHVTYFFNGGEEEPFPGEERILIPSPQEVETYDQKPQMSAFEVTEAVLEKIEAGDLDLIVLNFANGDMVGHTGVLEAAIVACATVDECVGRIEKAVLARGGRLIITSDHGNAEQMLDADGNPYTAHTVSNPVPFILVGVEGVGLRSGGVLADVAPTILELMGLDQPPEMTGRSLVIDPRRGE